MQKIACVFSFKMSSWVSCQKIVFNLHKAWQQNNDLELLNFNYSSDQPDVEIVGTAQAIINSKPDTIVIMDHKPHPLQLLQYVLPHFITKKPRIVFHIFGDFTLYYNEWDKLSKLLAGYEVDFIVASERQKILIDKFLVNPMKARVCPFPVDKHEFSYMPALRKVQREQWGLEENEIAFVFTGRLSLQKRIHILLKIFAEFIETTKNETAHLFLYGNADNVGDRFLSKWETEGEYFRKINRIYKSFPSHIQKRIHFMGSVPNKELKGVYQGADYLVNLSVHNDEDYGMSVAEAQCSGLPGIITDWGGLAGFHHEHLPEATQFIPVKIGERNKLLDSRAVLRAFEKCSNDGYFPHREKLSALALEKFGVQKASTIIQEMMEESPPVFSNFSPVFSKASFQVMFSSTPYVNQNKVINNLYRELYSSYVRNN
jgi:glycosyltransferase involved in cell wall biosynthesis